MRNYVLILLLFFSSASAVSAFAEQQVWKKIAGENNKAHLFQLDEEELWAALELPVTTNKTREKSLISLPLPSGKAIKVTAVETSVMAAELAAKYPEIKHWKVTSESTPHITGVIGFTTLGFHAMLLMPDGDTVFIQRDHNSKNALYKAISKQHDLPTHAPFSCGVHTSDNPIAYSRKLDPSFALKQAQGLRTYRLAMAATGEYTQKQGGKNAAMSAIAQTVARINEIYERDLSIRLELVAGNDQIIFTDPDTDPYRNGNSITLLARENAWTLNSANQVTALPGVIDRFIGSENYDIGHVVSITRGGVALVASVCQHNSKTSNHKAGASTGSNTPNGDVFDIDFVAHEMGHQLGATHTFNSTTKSCGGGERATATAYEPGGGSSIMAYAGICSPNNVQQHSDATFHIGSIEQINQYTRLNEGSGCGAIEITENNEPEIISMTENLVVDANTEFILTGEAIDSDGDELTYSWDQFDAGAASAIGIDKGNNALFRSTLPSTNPERLFPALAKTNRNLTFKFVVRDGKGGIVSRTTRVTVINGTTIPGSHNSRSGSFDWLLMSGLLLLALWRQRMIQRKNNA